MRSLRKIRSRISESESKNVFQILLLYWFRAVNMELKCFFLFVIPEIFNHLCCSLDTKYRRNLCLAWVKLLCKITNFTRIAGRLVPVSTTPTGVGRMKFAKLIQSSSERIFIYVDIAHKEIIGLQGMHFIIFIMVKNIHSEYCLNCHSDYVVHLAKCMIQFMLRTV